MVKKLIACGAILTALLMTTSAKANTPETATVTPKKLPSSVIDNIEVPFEVLDYAQMKYQGYAVTRVQKSYLNGEQIYRLRVDRDDLANDYDSIILLYTLKWKLITDEKMTAPPVFTNAPVDRTEEAEKPEDPPTNSADNRRDTEERPRPEEPVEDPEEPDEDAPSDGDEQLPGRRGRGNWEY